MYNPFSTYLSTKFRRDMMGVIKDVIFECENMPDGAWVAMITDRGYYSDEEKLAMREHSRRWKKTEDVFQAAAGILQESREFTRGTSYLSDDNDLTAKAEAMEKNYGTYQKQKELAQRAVIRAVLCDLYYQFDKDYD